MSESVWLYKNHDYTRESIQSVFERLLLKLQPEAEMKGMAVIETLVSELFTAKKAEDEEESKQ